MPLCPNKWKAEWTEKPTKIKQREVEEIYCQYICPPCKKGKKFFREKENDMCQKLESAYWNEEHWKMKKWR